MGLPKWLTILKHVGPAVLLFTPAAPIAPFLIAGIESAEQLAHAKSTEKLKHAKDVARAAIGAVNAQAGTQKIDPKLVDYAADDAIATVVSVANLLTAQTVVVKVPPLDGD